MPSYLNNTSRVTVVVPALNEAASIAAVIRQIREEKIADIIVVDDNSNDDTAHATRKAGATLLPLTTRLGAWGAAQAGLRYALANGSNIVVTMDADGQHEAREIPAILQPILDGDANFAIGTHPQRGSSSRHLAWWILKKLSGLKHADITSGFRAYDRKAALLLASAQASILEYQDIGVLVLLKNWGLVGAEVPVKMRSRPFGKSKIFESWGKVFIYMIYSIVLGLSKRGSKYRLAANSKDEMRHAP